MINFSVTHFVTYYHKHHSFSKYKSIGIIKWKTIFRNAEMSLVKK